MRISQIHLCIVICTQYLYFVKMDQINTNFDSDSDSFSSCPFHVPPSPILWYWHHWQTVSCHCCTLSFIALFMSLTHPFSVSGMFTTYFLLSDLASSCPFRVSPSPILCYRDRWNLCLVFAAPCMFSCLNPPDNPVWCLPLITLPNRITLIQEELILYLTLKLGLKGVYLPLKCISPLINAISHHKTVLQFVTTCGNHY